MNNSPKPSKHPLAGMTDVFKGSKPVEPSKLEDLLKALQPEESYAGKQTELDRARTQILSLVEEVIGSDEPKTSIDYRGEKRGNVQASVRNKLRAEMRLRKDAL